MVVFRPHSRSFLGNSGKFLLSTPLSVFQNLLNEIYLFTRSLPRSRLIPRASLKNHGLGKHLEIGYWFSFDCNQGCACTLLLLSKRHIGVTVHCSGAKKSSTYNWARNHFKSCLANIFGIWFYLSSWLFRAASSRQICFLFFPDCFMETEFTIVMAFERINPKASRSEENEKFRSGPYNKTDHLPNLSKFWICIACKPDDIFKYNSNSTMQLEKS